MSGVFRIAVSLVHRVRAFVYKYPFPNLPRRRNQEATPLQHSYFGISVIGIQMRP